MEVPEACGAWAAMAAALVVVMHLVFRASSPRSRPASCLADDEVYGNVGSNVGCLELLHQSILVMGRDGPLPHPLMAVSCVCWKENTPRSSMMRPSLCLPVSASVLPSILQSDRAIAHPPRRVPAPLQILYFVQPPGNIGTEDRESSGRVSPTQTQRARRRSTRRTGQAADPTEENLSDDGLFSACVTGGTGFLGGAIVRQMAASGRFGRIVVIDLRSPAADSPNRVAGVEYRVGDLCAAPRSVGDPLTAAFLGVDVVVHTAGRVVLYDDPHALYNAHVVATRHVIRAARRAGVRALLLTSSAGAVTTPYTLASQIDLPSDFQPPSNHHFPSHYATTKYRAERDAIAASTPAFPVCALRAPGIYGIQVSVTSVVHGPHSPAMRCDAPAPHL
jgi:NAD(P)-dependent dehydrogenase (short-subunit alcohol dehydrogenase family)